MVCMLLCGLFWLSIVQYANVFPCKVSNGLVWLCMVLYDLTQLCTIFVLVILLALFFLTLFFLILMFFFTFYFNSFYISFIKLYSYFVTQLNKCEFLRMDGQMDGGREKESDSLLFRLFCTYVWTCIVMYVHVWACVVM